MCVCIFSSNISDCISVGRFHFLSSSERHLANAITLLRHLSRAAKFNGHETWSDEQAGERLRETRDI